MSRLFDSVRVRAPRLNKFDLSHERKMSMNMGKLVPVLVEEVLPGDRFRVSTETLLRLAPMLAPMMHRVNVFIHYFFVPNRLIWDEWEEFITGGREGDATTVWPHVDIANVFEYPAPPESFLAPGSLADYLGVPDFPDSENAPTADSFISVLPFRAYQLIYDEYYRDQNLEAEVGISKASGEVVGDPEILKLFSMRTRAWEKDYFTSALPWAQRGAAIGVPLEGVGDVTYTPISEVINSGTGLPVDGDFNLGTADAATAGQLRHGNPDAWNVDAGGARIENIDEVTVDNVDFTINALRRAIKLQEWLEKNARGGARYTEQILSHFGVISSDARLQRPEYLGGGKSPIVISEVLQTSEDGGTPQGNMAGHGLGVGNTNRFARRFEEHGFIIGIMSVLPRTAYQDGLKRMFSRSSRFDYYWPEFAHLGEQEILNKEVSFLGVPGTEPGEDDATWGYQSRYAEYKYGCSSVHGDFRTTLSFWHMGRIFEDGAGERILPALDDAFVKSDPTHRIFAETDPTQHKVWCHVYHRVDALRPMPYYGTPSL